MKIITMLKSDTMLAHIFAGAFSMLSMLGFIIFVFYLPPLEYFVLWGILWFVYFFVLKFIFFPKGGEGK